MLSDFLKFPADSLRHGHIDQAKNIVARDDKKERGKVALVGYILRPQRRVSPYQKCQSHQTGLKKYNQCPKTKEYGNTQ